MSTLWSPTQNYDHLLVPISGYDGMHDLQYHAVPAVAEVFNRGSLISLDATGHWITGTGAVDSRAMPCWAINASADLDAGGDPAEQGNIAGARDRQDGQLLGGIAAFVATGGFELVTTEFDGAAPALAAYLLGNAPLIHDAVTPGFVTAGTLVGALPAIAESQVGVVSKGVRTEKYGQSVLQFWPIYNPARA